MGVRGLFRFCEEKYLEQMCSNGIIYCSPISKFKNGYDSEIRYDQNENITEIIQPHYAEISINGRIIKDFAGPTTIYIPQEDRYGITHIFCMTAIYDGDTFENSKLFDDKIYTFGDSFLAITDPQIFMNRIKTKVEKIYKEKGIKKYTTGRVKYVTDGDYSGKMDAYTKFSNYAWQKEFRIGFSCPALAEKPLEFDIGNIQDISMLVKISNFKNKVEFAGDHVINIT